jgi:hypothetical protein
LGLPSIVNGLQKRFETFYVSAIFIHTKNVAHLQLMDQLTIKSLIIYIFNEKSCKISFKKL